MNGQNAVQCQERFLNASDVAKLMGVSVATAYRIIRDLNSQLQQQGFITVSGKISSRYFYEKVYM